MKDIIDAHCLNMEGTVKDYKEEWKATRYLVGGKMFAMVGGDKEGAPILTVRLKPEIGHLLRDANPGMVVPGYYMNKEYWNSIYLEKNPPRELIACVLDQSYYSVYSKLPRKEQQRIQDEARKNGD